MSDFGGEMRLSINGAPLVVRAGVTVRPSSYNVTGIANQDGSVSRTFAPQGWRASVTFEDAPGTNWHALMGQAASRITLIEDKTGILHTWQGAFLTGEPSVDRMTGEVTGIELMARSYVKTAA